MNLQKLPGIIIIAVLLIQLSSCDFKSGEKKSGASELKAKPDTEFTDFFARNCCGMTGADGTYSVLLPDGRTAWIFGDTFLGTVNDDLSREKRHPVFIRNTVAIQDGDSLTTYHGEFEGTETSLVVPEGAPVGGPFSEDSLWYWPGDGFIENGKLKIFLSLFYQADTGNWGFRWKGTHMATFNIEPFRLEKVEIFNYPSETEIHWGHAVCDEAEDFNYIYGLGAGKPYVARVPKGDVMKPWEFFTGEGWSPEPNNAKPMVDFMGSEQFSVFKYKDEYAYVSQGGGFAGNVYSFISDNPYKGWKNKKELFIAQPPVADTNLFVYNAVAHPQFMKDNQVLVSYNVNSFELSDLFNDARKYRPIFYRVPVEMILNE